MHLTPQAIIHPEDSAALQKLETVPLFSAAVRSFLKVFDEHFLAQITSKHHIRLGPHQLPHIYDHLQEICQLLEIQKPELYLEIHHDPFSYTLGEHRKFIIISTAMLDCLDDDGVRIILAHECGHIFFNHVLYRSMTKMLLQYGDSLPRPLSAISAPLRIALLYWYFKSEQSADRIAALFGQNVEQVLGSILRAAEAPALLVEQINWEEVSAQVNSDETEGESTIQKLMETIIIGDTEHPFTARRVKELLAWGQSSDFKQWRSLLQSPPAPAVCSQCHQPLNNNQTKCPACGQVNPNAIAIHY